MLSPGMSAFLRRLFFLAGAAGFGLSFGALAGAPAPSLAALAVQLAGFVFALAAFALDWRLHAVKRERNRFAAMSVKAVDTIAGIRALCDEFEDGQ